MERHLRAGRVLITFLFLSFTLPASAYNPNKLTSHELGTTESIYPLIKFVKDRLQAYDQARRVTAFHRQSKANHDHSENIWKELYALRDLPINIIKTKTSREKLHWPETMESLGASFRRYGVIGKEMLDSMNGSGITSEQWQNLVTIVRRLLTDYNTFIAFTEQRNINYGETEMKYNLTLELKPIPLKIDLISGEVKVTASGSLGPFKFGAGAGPTARSGVKTLIIVAHGMKRYYAIGNRSLTILLPSSMLTVSGDTITIIILES